jgi:hypothetical protein
MLKKTGNFFQAGNPPYVFCEVKRCFVDRRKIVPLK